MVTLTPETLGVTLRELRNEQGITLMQMVEKTNMPYHTLQRIETGESSPSFDNLHRIVKGLNKKVVLQ